MGREPVEELHQREDTEAGEEAPHAPECGQQVQPVWGPVPGVGGGGRLVPHQADSPGLAAARAGLSHVVCQPGAAAHLGTVLADVRAQTEPQCLPGHHHGGPAVPPFPPEAPKRTSKRINADN